MANVDNPHGLQLCCGRNYDGGEPVVKWFKKVVGYATAIFNGDAVNRVADGSIEVSATPGTTAYTGVSLNHGAASTLTQHAVVVSPSSLFEAQDNSDTDGFAEADMGLNVNLELNAGSATTKLSGHELDESTATTTNSLDVHMHELFGVPDNAYGAWSRIVVTFNKHRAGLVTAGV